MATSGSIDLSFTRDQIIQEAYELLQVVEPGVAATTAQITSAARTLNNMIKAWQVQGLAIHSVVRGYLFPEDGKFEYTLDGAVDRWVSRYDETTVATAAAAGVGTVTVASDADITNGDVIGVYQDDGTIHWTTVNGVPAADVVTLTAVTTDEISVGAQVFNYDGTNELAVRPMEVIEIWEHNSEGNDRPIDLVSRQEYAELTLKNNEGALVSAFYDPQVGTNNRLFIWPASDDLRSIIGTWCKRSFEDFDAANDEVDLPQEAFEAVAFNLAKRMISKSAVKQMIAQYILAMAQSTEDQLFDEIAGPEDSVLFSPDMDR